MLQVSPLACSVTCSICAEEFNAAKAQPIIMNIFFIVNEFVEMEHSLSRFYFETGCVPN